MFFKEIAVEQYIPDINPERSLLDQPLLPETKQILGMLYCYYWSKEEEIKDIPNDVIKDAKKIKNEIFNEYSPDKFFEGAKKRRENVLGDKEDTGDGKLPWYKRMFK